MFGTFIINSSGHLDKDAKFDSMSKLWLGQLHTKNLIAEDMVDAFR
jgi:hypothetical protein